MMEGYVVVPLKAPIQPWFDRWLTETTLPYLEEVDGCEESVALVVERRSA